MINEKNDGKTWAPELLLELKNEKKMKSSVFHMKCKERIEKKKDLNVALTKKRINKKLKDGWKKKKKNEKK